MVKSHVECERQSLPEIQAKIEAMYGSAVVPRVCIDYDRLKRTAANMHQGITELEAILKQAAE